MGCSKNGEYFDNISPVDGKLLTRIPRSNEEDVRELAIQAAKKLLNLLNILQLLKEVQC